MPSNQAILAQDILSTVRRRVLQHNPLLTQAIYRLQPDCQEGLPVPLSTDGRALFYNPALVTQAFNDDPNSLVYQLLHICAHCLLGHFSLRGSHEPELFDPVADFKAHRFIRSLCPDVKCKHTRHRLDYAFAPLPVILSHVNNDPVAAKKYQQLHPQHFVDIHELWNPDYAMSVDENGNNWGSLSQNLADALKKGGRQQGDDEGAVIRDLQMASGQPRDYTVLLEEFLQSTLQEEPSPTDLDPMWYHFGLDYFGDIPIIEPAEEALKPRVGTFVIAIDTSGSCEGDLCAHFLREMSQVMEGLNTMDSLNRVLVVQCDQDIQDQQVVESLSQWHDLVEHFKLKGGGGTDFCPVFELAETIDDIVGLLYFTDGYGDFPDQEPTFPTRFLLDSDDIPSYAPAWIKPIVFSDI